MHRSQSNWYDLRSLRVNPPGYATKKADRKKALSTSLAQFEQLTESAAQADLIARPILLYYGLVQAGQALIAAYGKQSQTYRGHGLEFEIPQKQREPAPYLERRLEPKSRGTIQSVAEAIKSPILPTEGIELGAIWQALPIQSGPLPAGNWPKSLRIEESTPWVLCKEEYAATLHGVPDSLLLPPGDADTGILLRSFLSKYPATDGWTRYHSTLTPRGTGYVRLTWPKDVGPRMSARRDCAATGAMWLVPNLGSKEPPEILLLWWLTLFALSMTARYEPDTWAKECDFDISVLAVPLQVLLDEALEALPALVLATLKNDNRRPKPTL